MPSPDSKATPMNSPKDIRTARVDDAHAPEKAAGGSTSKTSKTVLKPLSEDELRQHARQLEAILKRRQQELDHRESQLNARMAEFERESRAARLWMVERERELSVAQNSFQRPEIQSGGSAQATAPVPSPAATSHSESQLKRELQLDQREQELNEREKIVRKCREELFAAREETLEIRLATEELWRQLCDALPPEAVNRSVGRIRERLAEHYRLVREDLNDYRAQLETLRCDLDEKLEHWAHRKGELASWAQQRMIEVDNYHSAVAERAVMIDQRQSELTLLQAAWRQDRQELETRIARLQQRLDQAGKPVTGSVVPAPHLKSTASKANPLKASA